MGHFFEKIGRGIRLRKGLLRKEPLVDKGDDVDALAYMAHGGLILRFFFFQPFPNFKV